MHKENDQDKLLPSTSYTDDAKLLPSTSYTDDAKQNDTPILPFQFYVDTPILPFQFYVEETSEKNPQKRKEHHETQAKNFLKALKKSRLKGVIFPANATAKDHDDFANAMIDQNNILIPPPKEGENAEEYYAKEMEGMKSGKLFGGADKKQEWSGHIFFVDTSISPKIHKMIDREVANGAMKGTSYAHIHIKTTSKVTEFANNAIHKVESFFTPRQTPKEAEKKLLRILRYASKNNKATVSPDDIHIQLTEEDPLPNSEKGVKRNNNITKEPQPPLNSSGKNERKLEGANNDEFDLSKLWANSPKVERSRSNLEPLPTKPNKPKKPLGDEHMPLLSKGSNPSYSH